MESLSVLAILKEPGRADFVVLMVFILFFLRPGLREITSMEDSLLLYISTDCLSFSKMVRLRPIATASLWI